MNDNKVAYTADELAEFEVLINEKLERSRADLQHLKDSIMRSKSGKDSNHNGGATIDDGTDAMEKEQLNQMAARQQKFIKQLENALVRIKNGTYGICVDTGKLISRDRLKAVPHTMHSIEAKRSK